MITKVVEEYVEVIYTLERKHNIANTTNIATLLDVKPASVTEMLKKLDGMKLVNYRPYKGATLTQKGITMAKELSKKHRTLANFLKLVGVDNEIAELDACQIEHIVTQQTLEKLKEFVKQHE